MKTLISRTKSTPNFLPQSPTFRDHTWVKLPHPPSAYAYDEALLLCEISPDRWWAWVPGYGQIEIDRHEFHY